MTASTSKVVEALGASVPFSLELILVEIEGGRYISLILLISLADLVAGRVSAGGSSTSRDDGGGGRI